MALNPQSKSVLDTFTMIAKKIIYHPGRMQDFMHLLGTPQGAVMAVQSVIAVMEKRKPVPQDVLPILGVNIYLAMVDVAQEATNVKADKGVMMKVIQAILTKVTASQQSAQQMAKQAQPATKPSLLDSMKGVPA